MKKLLITALLISLVAVSCKKEQAEPEITTETATESNIIIPVASAETAPSVQEVQTTESNMMMQNSNTAALNPAHGQPGHRCEIPVGAPLNSTPKAANVSKPATPTPTNIPVNAPQLGATNTNGSANATVNQVTAPGMNPPHGQPGHTCSVAVGAPLPTTN